MIAAAAVTLAVLATSASARQMTVKNNCDFTVWPAIFTDPSSGDSPDHATGWEAAGNLGAPLSYGTESRDDTPVGRYRERSHNPLAAGLSLEAADEEDNALLSEDTHTPM